MGAYLVLDDLGRFREAWSDTPPTSLAWVPSAMAAFLGHGWYGLPATALLACAAVRRGTCVQALLVALNPHELAEHLTLDLGRSLGETPTAGRTAHHRVLRDVRRALGRPDDDGQLTEGYHACLALTGRAQYRPPQRRLPEPGGASTP